jgi:ABC-type dipeptide/oligopeptide/nickel transport system ATPase component
VRSRIIIRGEVPNPINPPLGCRFRTRRFYARCSPEELEMHEVMSDPAAP